MNINQKVLDDVLFPVKHQNKFCGEKTRVLTGIIHTGNAVWDLLPEFGRESKRKKFIQNSGMLQPVEDSLILQIWF